MFQTKFMGKIKILIRKINVSDEIYGKNQNIHFVLDSSFFPPENLTYYEIIWKNMV